MSIMGILGALAGNALFPGAGMLGGLLGGGLGAIAEEKLFNKDDGNEDAKEGIKTPYFYQNNTSDADVFTYSFFRKSMMVDSDRCICDGNMMMAILRCVARLESQNCETCTFLT